MCRVLVNLFPFTVRISSGRLDLVLCEIPADRNFRLPVEPEVCGRGDGEAAGAQSEFERLRRALCAFDQI